MSDKVYQTNKMKKTGFVIIVLLAVIQFAAVSGCSKSGNTGGGGSIVYTPDCSGASPGFAANVMPLIQSKCATAVECHASGSTNSGGPFTNHAQVSARASNIKSQVATGAMPQTGSLTSAEKNTILCWIKNGALNN
jgi:hypothetical protein